MTTLLIVLHVLVCLALIAVVLLQGGKGAEIGASFGAGSSQTVFGATGGKNFMSRLTTGAAVIFMLTSLTLAYFYGDPGATSVMPSQVGSQQSQQAPGPGQLAPAPTKESSSGPAPAKEEAEPQPAPETGGEK